MNLRYIRVEVQLELALFFFEERSGHNFGHIQPWMNVKGCTFSGTLIQSDSVLWSSSCPRPTHGIHVMYEYNYRKETGAKRSWLNFQTRRVYQCALRLLTCAEHSVQHHLQHYPGVMTSNVALNECQSTPSLLSYAGASVVAALGFGVVGTFVGCA